LNERVNIVNTEFLVGEREVSPGTTENEMGDNIDVDIKEIDVEDVN
jgi:hypothetical protein